MTGRGPTGLSPSGADTQGSAGEFIAADVEGMGYAFTSSGVVWSPADRPFAERPSSDSTSPRDRRPAVDRDPVPPTLPERIFADARPSVAFVTTLSDRAEKYRIVRSIAGTGSGLVWDDQGHIVTSRHVIEYVQGANVRLSDGSRWQAKLINFDRESDVAVLQIKRRGKALTPIRVGTSADLVVGMTAFNVSSPYALMDSLTSGLISGLNRDIQTPDGLQLRGMIQTDAPTHTGSSGGALIDDQGRVIGMNTAVPLESGHASGVGFAIPIDSLQEIVPRLIRTGMQWHHDFGFVTLQEFEVHVSSPQRGGGSPLSRPGAPELPSGGLVVTNVETSSGAAKAGLRAWVPLQSQDGSLRTVPRDILIGVDGAPISSGIDVEAAIAKLGPGEPLKVDIWRNGMELSVLIHRTADLEPTVRKEER